MKIIAIAICSVLGVVIAANQPSQSTRVGDKGEIMKTPTSRNTAPAHLDDQDIKTADLLSSDPESEVSGKLMKVFLVAYKSFIKDSQIPSSKKALENYIIEFRQDTEFYYLTFAGSGTPGDRHGFGGESRVSKSVLYKISKKEYRMVSRKFYR